MLNPIIAKRLDSYMRRKFPWKSVEYSVMVGIHTIRVTMPLFNYCNESTIFDLSCSRFFKLGNWCCDVKHSEFWFVLHPKGYLSSLPLSVFDKKFV